MPRRASGAVVRAIRSAAERSDLELLTRFSAGDESAFAALVERHSGLVLGVCRRSLPTVQDAEDACQAVFVILAKKAPSIRWQASVANWLYTTARRVASKANRAAARRAKREAQAAPLAAVSHLDQMTGREAFAALDEELDKLAPTYREPLVLCYLQGLTRDEAATRLGVPAATLKSQLERGKKKLGDALTRRGIVPGAALLAVAATSTARAVSPALHKCILASVSGSPSAAVAALTQGVAVKKWIKGLSVAVLALASLSLAAAGKADKASMAKKEPTPAPVLDSKPVVVTGTVVGVDGKPAVGVKLFHPSSKVARPVIAADISLRELGKTDDAGRFRVTLTGHAPRRYLIAHSPGSGIDWAELSEADGKEVHLRLVPDVPIRGRVVTTEGKPAAGVRVSAVAVYVPVDGKLDGYLAAWKADLRQAVATPRKRLYCPLDGVTGSATSDADGKFALAGVGADRVVHLVAEGGGTARQNPMVVTRAGFDPKPYNEQLLEKRHDALRLLNHFRGLNGPDFTLVAERGRALSGTVTDPAGKPIAGVVVTTSTGWGDGVSVVTGADGKYRLEGVPKQKGYNVNATPPRGAGYMDSSSGAADAEGHATIRHDIKLSRGVVVVGRVTDKLTGKGIKAGVRLAPLPGNKFFGSGVGTDSYRINRVSAATDADGRFRLVTIPGRSLLLVQAQQGEKFDGEYLNPFRRATPDPAHKDLFQYDADDESWTVATVDNSIEFLDTHHAVRVLDVKESGETVAEVTVERGVTGRVEVRGPDGKPLAGAFVAGLADSWPVTYKLPEAAATVYALDPARPRTLAVFHPGKNLAGVATIRGDEKEPVVVKLAPTGIVTGRLVEEGGAALVGAEVTVNAPRRVFSELYRFTVKERPKSLTDAAGNFSLPAVVPGMEFFLQIKKGEQFYSGKPKIGRLNLKAGETKSLGARTIEQQR